MGGRQSIPLIIDDNEIKKFSHFPISDVKSWLNTLKTKYNNKLSEQDIQNIFNSLFPFGDSRLFAKNLFRTLNISNNKYLSFNEIMIAYSILFKGSRFERLRWIFRFYDVDNDGLISKNEMFRVLKSVEVMVGFFYDEFVDAEALVNEFFLAIDNHSGFINFEDFKRLVEIKGCATRLFESERELDH